MWIVLQLLGVLLVVAGVAMVSVPAAFVVGGVAVVVVGFLAEPSAKGK